MALNAEWRIKTLCFQSIDLCWKCGYVSVPPQHGCSDVVSDASFQSVSELLAKWRAGDEESLTRLVPLVYKTLHRLAHYHLRKERPDHTLQTTALVHEAYLCLAKQEPMEFENRAHFFAVCAQVMREVLVQYARRRKAAKNDKDAAAEVPYLSFATAKGPQRCNFVSYDDEQSVAAKGAWAKSSGLGGAMIWTVAQGHLPSAPAGQQDPLLKALYNSVAP